MDKLITGSHAIKHWFPELKRTPNDLDYIVNDQIKQNSKVEYHWIPEFQYFLDNNKDETYLDPNFLYTLKLSHAGWDIHWGKTMSDILFLKSKGCEPISNLYKTLVKGWIKVHGRKWASLKNKDSESFFIDSVNRKYVHDDIHDAIAVYDKPLYEKLIVEGVSCSEDAFNLLSEDDKVLLAKEEIWVTALERYHIPSNFSCGHYFAYGQSLKKLATTMSSGYFKYFILTNFDKIHSDKTTDYILKFKEAEKNNKLRTYEKH